MSALATASKVQLMPLGLRHAGNMFRWMLDPEVSANIGLRSDPSLSRTEHWIARAVNDPAVLPIAVYWMNRHVGNVVFDRIEAGSARLSVYIGESDARGKGVGTMALTDALEDVFSSRNFKAVWLTVHHRNQKARHIYEKLGFQNEREAPEEAIHSLRMILTRADWMKEAR